jgi:hypothetical protein
LDVHAETKGQISGQPCIYHLTSFSEEEYGYGERVPSKYDTDEIREAVSKLLENLNRKPEPITGSSFRWYEYTTDKMALRNAIEFEDDSDLVLLIYEFSTVMTHIPRVHIAYVKPHTSFFVLEDGFGLSLEEHYNEMVEASPGALGLPLLCRACLLVTLKYDLGTTVIIERAEDIYLAATWFGTPPERMPFKFCGPYWFYSMLPSRDSDFVSWAMPIWRSSREGDVRFDSDMRRVLDSLGVKAPDVEVKDSLTVVTLSVYNFVISGEVANWRLEFLANGRLRYMWYAEPPIWRFPGWGEESPYNWIEKFELRQGD